MQARTGCDFRCYKKSTILGRIERRHGTAPYRGRGPVQHAAFQDANEVSQLLKDLLINVTSFFRDPEAFEELRQQAIVPLVQAKQTDEPLRVWVPGCGEFGEEAYSLAMLLMEEIAAAHKQLRRPGIRHGHRRGSAEIRAVGRLPGEHRHRRGGQSPGEVLRPQRVGLSNRRLAAQVGGLRRAEPDYRPSFSKMDIINCRNLLIYLDADTQGKLMPLMNFALNPGGYLFLGKSEGISGRSDLFDVVSKKARLYRRLAPAGPIALETPIFPGRARVISSGPSAVLRPPVAAFTDVIRQTLLSHFSASIVLVDRKGQVLQFHGQTGKYLNLPTGEPRLNLLDMAKQGLALKLRSAMHKTIEDGRAVVLKSLSVTSGESHFFVRVTVVPVSQRGETAPLLAVIFEDVAAPATAEVAPAPPAESETFVEKQLEDELKAAQSDLQSTIDDVLASNEELRVANEEVISSNEELQSTNEELETSKEELQSINEELTTVNSQLQEKVHQLNTANSDMANLLESSKIATLFLDNQLQIKFFTPAMMRVLNLIPADMGRPLPDCQRADRLRRGGRRQGRRRGRFSGGERSAARRRLVIFPARRALPHTNGGGQRRGHYLSRYYQPPPGGETTGPDRRVVQRRHLRQESGGNHPHLEPSGRSRSPATRRRKPSDGTSPCWFRPIGQANSRRSSIGSDAGKASLPWRPNASVRTDGRLLSP